MSGGGVWEIRLVEKAGILSWDGERNLRGVAFWESDESDDRQRTIRCHGPRSLFERAWELWELPQKGVLLGSKAPILPGQVLRLLDNRSAMHSVSRPQRAFSGVPR